MALCSDQYQLTELPIRIFCSACKPLCNFLSGWEHFHIFSFYTDVDRLLKNCQVKTKLDLILFRTCIKFVVGFRQDTIIQFFFTYLHTPIFSLSILTESSANRSRASFVAFLKIYVTAWVLLLRVPVRCIGLKSENPVSSYRVPVCEDSETFGGRF